MKTDNEPPTTEQSLKSRKSKSREVSSRFLSPTTSPAHDSGLQSPNKALSPLRRKSTSTDTRKHRSLEDPGGLLRGLWPSSTTTSSSSSTPKLGTLADHLGNERLKDFIERKSHEKRTSKGSFSLNKQTTHTEVSRFVENIEKESAKENHGPSLGGSMRYTAKLGFPKKSLSPSTSSSSSPNILPGRFSVDENALFKRASSQRKSDSESELSDQYSASNTNSPAITKTNSSLSFRKSGIEVSSKFLQEVLSKNRSRDTTWDSNIPNPVSADSSPKMNKKFTIKNAIRRANSLTGHGTSTSQWALSPGRSGSPPMSVENMVKPMSFSSLKSPNSPSRTRGVEKLLNMGLMDLFKSRKSSTMQVGSGDVESVHQLRLIQNRLMQWRYANGKADAVNKNITTQVENYLLYGWNSLMKLQYSVLQKKLKLQKEKLEIKMDFILQSQMKALESWADMERQHLSAISMTKECLHSVVCKVPLIEGAKLDAKSASLAVRHAFDLTASIKLMLTAFSPGTEKTALLLSELAEVVAQEKLLLEECLELFRMISILEIQDRSLMCYVIQLNSQQRQMQQQQQQQEQEEIFP
ncbi:LOW QUALITY PROTEIN: QWRF motif-containing protein 3-like [Durio zibethinus]|uniref:LOW QUALITY PROTEIN: QWRF motif-containing protein 3-like n=1 Tax=Durio zibethinus TaxID=66656 RepID=A0A6P5XGB4_DURZI|nr:LOW QUALITY PROTEIN: QWRF motif-containing protein 3-like [Durio zibethinus]